MQAVCQVPVAPMPTGGNNGEGLGRRDLDGLEKAPEDKHHVARYNSASSLERSLESSVGWRFPW